MLLALGSTFNDKQFLDWFSLENAAWLQHKFGGVDGAMLLRPWSLRPRLFKTSLGHYVPWFITSFDHNVPS